MSGYRQAMQVMKRTRRGSADGNPGGGSGTPDAGQSTCTATTPVNTGNLSTVTITVKSASGTPLSGVSATIAVSGSNNTINQPGALTNGSGVTTATFSSTTAETKTVTATAGGVTITQQPSVVVNSGGGSLPTPDFVEDFSSYANQTAWQNGSKYSLGEDVGTFGTNLILDTTDGVNIAGLSLTQCMKIVFPANSGNCHDNTYGRNLNLVSPVSEGWFRFILKFDATWTNDNSCGGVANPDYKSIFLRVNNNRYNLMFGTSAANRWTWGYPGNNDNEQVVQSVFDNTWHIVDMHAKINASTGIAKLALDNAAISGYQYANVNTGTQQIYGIALGRNINEGPPAQQAMKFGYVAAWFTDPGFPSGI